ncbi:SGNH/GDSL hydrolase family protein [Marinilactibacillus kalidii]|uniref:SGNH/GDSL hydrolase family protein n=1 Tax=Marinilactibacillus kalidii TaxID=2820274 RepID=UPI001ABEBD38
MNEQEKSAHQYYLVGFFAIMIFFSVLYWGLNRQQESISQELTSDHSTVYAQDSETFVDRVRYLSNRDGVVDIAVLGSSVTRGVGSTISQPVWGKLMEQELNRLKGIRATVWNQGFNGFSTTDLMVQGKIQETIELNPDIVIFELSLINNNRFPQNDLAQTKEELIATMNRFREALPETLVILTSANPTIYNDVYLDDGVLTYEQYNEEIGAFVRNQAWPFIDIYTLMKDEIAETDLEVEDYLYDAVHPNGDGYALWYSLLEDKFNQPLSVLSSPE